MDQDPDEQTRLSHPKVAKVVVDKDGYNAARYINGLAHRQVGDSGG